MSNNMMMFTYKVKYYDEDFNLLSECGVIFKPSYAEAAEYLAQCFGEDELASLKIFGCDNNVCHVALPKDIVNKLEKEEFPFT